MTFCDLKTFVFFPWRLKSIYCSLRRLAKILRFVWRKETVFGFDRYCMNFGSGRIAFCKAIRHILFYWKSIS